MLVSAIIAVSVNRFGHFPRFSGTKFCFYRLRMLTQKCPSKLMHVTFFQQGISGIEETETGAMQIFLVR